MLFSAGISDEVGIHIILAVDHSQREGDATQHG